MEKQDNKWAHKMYQISIDALEVGVAGYRTRRDLPKLVDESEYLVYQILDCNPDIIAIWKIKLKPTSNGE